MVHPPFVLSGEHPVGRQAAVVGTLDGLADLEVLEHDLLRGLVVGRPTLGADRRVPEVVPLDGSRSRPRRRQAEGGREPREDRDHRVGEHGEVAAVVERLRRRVAGDALPPRGPRAGRRQGLLGRVPRGQGSVPREHDVPRGRHGVLVARSDQLRVHEGRVVVLRVVLDQDLPVEGGLVAVGAPELEVVEAVRRKALDQRARVEGRRVRVEVDHDRAGEGRDPHRDEAVVVGIEALGRTHTRGPGQRAVQPEHPRVVRARQGPGGAAPLGHGRPPVAADVQKGPQHAVVSPDQQHGDPVGDRRGQVAPRLLDLVGAGHPDPGPAEDPVHLQGVVVGVGVPVPGQGPGLSHRTAPPHGELVGECSGDGAYGHLGTSDGIVTD